MDYADAIKAWRKRRDLTQAQLAEALGYPSQSRIGNYEKRDRQPSWEDYEKMAEYFGCATVPEFLAGPDGQQTLEEEAAPVTDETHFFVTKVRGVLLSAGPGIQVSWEHEEVDHSHAFTKAWMRGKGINPKRARILPVVGDSMSPYVRNGDVVLVNLEKNKLRSGEVFAIAVGDETRIKRLVRRADGAVEVRSDNPSPEHATEVLRGQEIDMLKIIGMVEWRGG
jgi:phage repressor protein C with HTH and peptisase S24 domain